MQRYTVRRAGNKAYIACEPGVPLVADEADAVDLVVACGENETDCLLLHAASLPPAFFDLSTGLAGELLHRFGIYRMRVAVVLDADHPLTERFRELLAESNRGRELGIFQTLSEAEAWLLAD